MNRNLRTPEHLALMRALIESRKGRGLTQKTLAAKLGRVQSFVAKIEVGERRVDAVELAEWSIATDTDLVVIMAGVMTALRQGKPDDKS